MAEEPEVVPEGTELPPGTNKLYQNTYRQKPEQYGEASSASHPENPLVPAFRTSPPPFRNRRNRRRSDPAPSPRRRRENRATSS